jgi:hypothetical protein
VTPVYTASVDYDSNRALESEPEGTESAVLSADLKFKRAMENSDLIIEPRYTFRRYSDQRFGNGDAKSVTAQYDWLNESLQFSANGSFSDQSTLLSELLETGILRTDTHQVLLTAGSSLSWSQDELHLLVASFNISDTKYHGAGEAQLPGYRYPTGSLGERFVLNERGSLTVSGFGSILSTDTAGNSSREYGVQAELIYQVSERTHFDGSYGISSRLLAGQSSRGTDASATLTHDFTRANASFTYTKSLVPYGVGFLVQRQQETLASAYHVTEYLDANVSVSRVDNNQLAVLLRIDRPNYDLASAGLTWHPTETWAIGALLSAIRTQPPLSLTGTVNEWRSTVSLTWNPRPTAQSW